MTFKPMLAHSKSPDPKKLSYPLIGQLKLDGIRCTVVDGQAKSRTLKDIPNDEIRAYLSRPEFNGLDGEIVVGPPNAQNAMQATTSFVMSADKTGEDWKFYVFDGLVAIDGDDMRHWYFSDRYNETAQVIELVVNHPERIELVANYDLQTPEMVELIEATALAQGYEGIILRDPNGAYKYGRSGVAGPLLKLKRFEDGEALIIGWEEEMHNGNEAKQDAFGRTERSSHKENKTGKGTLGAFIVEDVVTKIQFNVGTGFTANQRKHFWNERTELLNANTVIKYKSFPTGVKDKPRHPVFLGFRNMEIDG